MDQLFRQIISIEIVKVLASNEYNLYDTNQMGRTTLASATPFFCSPDNPWMNILFVLYHDMRNSHCPYSLEVFLALVFLGLYNL